MIVALSPDTGRPIEIEGERLTAVRDCTAEGGGVWVAPGFIDLQVNGFGGVDYNSPDAGLEEIARSIGTLRSTGVTRFFPTVITGAGERMCGALQNLARAREMLRDGGVCIAGFHVEGPFISPEDGP